MGLADCCDWKTLLAGWLGVEGCFYVIYHAYLIPRANKLTLPVPYREERAHVLHRILDRLQKRAKELGQPMPETLAHFMERWFFAENEKVLNQSCIKRKSSPLWKPSLSSTTSATSDSSHTSDNDWSSSSSSSSSEEDDSCRPLATLTSSWSLPIHASDLTAFFSWGFYGKEVFDLTRTEESELQSLFQILHDRTGWLVQSPSSLNKHTRHRQPRRLSLENVNSWYRPLLVYFLVWILQKFVGQTLLYVHGYRRVKAKNGLVGWYRPGPQGNLVAARTPLLFFHGIAPGGWLLYLPMLLWGGLDHDRSMLLLENRSISCTLGFDAFSEADTIQGLQELVCMCYGAQQALTICGHSFGACPITWILHAPALRKRLAQIILLDPVTLLLSESDVMVNFLYACPSSSMRLLAASELFTEYYLRRHFSWYNAELWLEQIPISTQILLCVSECDEIVCGPKICREVQDYQKLMPNVQLLYWPKATHGQCISSPTYWQQIQRAILQQEGLNVAPT